MKILVTGSTGLVGTALTGALLREGHTVCRLVRPESAASVQGGGEIAVKWNPATGEMEGSAAGADAVVNLAGASIASGRWNAARKSLLLSSRVNATRQLVGALGRLNPAPKVLVSAAATGYYGNRGDNVLTEESAPGDGFLAELARDWEAEAARAEALGMRVARLRFGVILAKRGGALPQMMLPFRLGAGGRIGSGRQWMSWLTLDDAVAMIRFALENEAARGALNAVAPQAVRNAEFTRALAKALHRPAIFPAPAFALRLALGEMADALLLSSQRVVPQKLQQMGYRFVHPELAGALEEVLRK
ncbi:MAG TPA: TIGR01777 family oxidoreductase [Candidatus Acidoferrales bacterium]|nr:TIGR01777 family oxidoreductase [Candidatus Acidoferrales bacterium]